MREPAIGIGYRTEPGIQRMNVIGQGGMIIKSNPLEDG
jgi:hypothetical protein